VLSGGAYNQARFSDAAVMSGGRSNEVLADFATALAGVHGDIGAGAMGSTLAAAGRSNTVIGFSECSSAFGGPLHSVWGNFDVVLGVNHTFPSSADASAVLGGQDGEINSANHATLIGGDEVRAVLFAEGGVMIGGSNNVGIASYSLAIHQYDASAGALSAFTAYSPSTNSVSFGCAGGVRFTSGSLAANQTVSWTPGGAAWSFTSDRNTKEHFAPVDASDVLGRLVSLPVYAWNYIGYTQRHVGPVAQDFHASFPWSGSETTLNTLDLYGLSLAAIQELERESRGRDEDAGRIRKLEADWQQLKQRIHE
jgi:hypothetical protein